MGPLPEAQLWRLYNLLPMGLVAAITLVWSASPSLAVIVRGTGLLSAPDARRGFYALTPGQVQAVLVKVGQTVRPAQPLLTIDQIGQNAPGPRGPAQAGSPQTISARLKAVQLQLQALQQQQLALEDQQLALDRRRTQIATTNQPVKSQLDALNSLRQDGVIATYSPL